MENTIDLRKTGAENIIGKFSKKHSSQHIIPVRENGSFIVGANIYMTARQAETILMLSDFLENAQVVILSIVRIENQRLMSCVKTLCSNLQCLFVLWLKALQVYLL
jgi:hypothetical protein